MNPRTTPRLSRRELSLLAAAAALAPATVRAEPPTPVIIAEGGSSESQIEDTRGALDLAISEGCDFLQVNVTPSKDGALVARRDSELSATTNVATITAFADRKTTKNIAGENVSGWFAEDFTLEELKTLACRERNPDLKPQLAKLNDKSPILTLVEVLDIARAGCVRTARTIGVCPRLVRARDFDDLGIPVEERLAAVLATAGYVAPAAAIWVEAREPATLRAFGRLSRVRLMQLVEVGDAKAMTASEALTDIKAYAQAIGPDQDLVFDPAAAVFPAPTTLVLDAKSAGLMVISRTARSENRFLPQALRKGDRRAKDFDRQHGDVDKLLFSLFANGVDGVSTDVPAQAVRARASAIAAIARAKAKAAAKAGATTD